MKINNRLLIDDYVSNNLFNYHYIGRQSKVDEILCMGYSEHFTGIDGRDVIIDSGGGSNNNKKDIVENCKKVIISPYTTVKGRKSHYTFYVKTADYKGRGLYSEIDVDGTGTVVFPEIDLLSDCDQITYSVNSNTLSLKVNFGQNNQFTLDIKNYVEKSSNKPHFALIDKNGSNIVPKIEKSDSPIIEIKSFELHSEYSLDNFNDNDVENHYKKILNNNKDYTVFGIIRDEVQDQRNSTVLHVIFGSSGDDIINFDQGTMFARGGKGNDVYVIGDGIGNREVRIDNNSDDGKLDMLLIPVVEKDFSIQQCDLHLNYNNTSIQVKNYLQDHNYRHLIVMNDKGEAFIPNIQSMSCSPSSSEKGKLVPFLQATQTQNMFLLSKDFQDDHIVIDSHLEDIEKYKDKDDLLLIRERRESEIPFIIRMEGFYTDRSKWENISYSLWNNNDLFPSSGLLENVDDVMDYKDKLRTDYERIVKEYVVDFSNSTGTIKHNQKLERDISTFVGQDEERIGVIILKNITPDRVEISSNGVDLIFCDKRSNHTVNIKSWNNVKSYRISTLEFDLDLESIIISKLDRFNLSEVRKIQDLIEKASENYKNKDKYTPKIENDFKCLVSIDSFESENKNSTYQCLGFSSLQDQISFTENFCSLEQLTEFRDKSNSTQISALSRKLQNNLSLNGYDQNVVDQCSKLILAEENNQQVVGKISSMVKNIEESTSLHHIAATSGRSLSEPKNGLNLGSCLGHRGKRDTNRCLALWKDIDKFNEEESEKRSVNKIKINSEIFVYYIKDVEDESRRVQLIDLASQVEVTGKFQDLVNKIVRSREAISHLNKVGKVSGALMYGMMAKNALADFLNDDYKGVAINLGFIAGGRGLTKIAKAVSTKGVGLITDGKVLLGRSLKAASPFLARSTSAFVVYDLANQIKELESGDKDALIPVIGDSVYLGIDAAEIGIEVAEAFEVLEGVSSVTGPIGTTIGAVVFIGTDVYMAVKRVDKIDKVVHLTGGEKFIEGLRAFIGMKPEQYVEELMGKKQANNQLVKQGLEYLKQHNDIQRYVFPTGRSVIDSCDTFTIESETCLRGYLSPIESEIKSNIKRSCVGTGTGMYTTSKYEKCKVKIQVDLNSTASFDKKVDNVIYDRTKPDNPNEGKLFCLPTDPIRPESQGENTYLCHNAIGLQYPANRTGNYTLIALEKGRDVVIGFKDSPNIFLIDDGNKEFTGGDKDDLFILVGNEVTGRLNGGGGNNTLSLAEFSLNENLNIKPDSHKNDSSISSSSNNIRIKNMNIIYGRKGKQDIVDCGCDVRYVDGQGGISNNSPDNITIPYCYRPSEKKIIVRPSTEINNLDQSSNGNFDYIILPDKGKANINIEPDYTFTRQRKHNFLFNYTLFDLASVDITNIKDINHWHAGYGNMTHTIRNVTFSFLSPLLKGKSINEKFDITISDIPANASYILSDNTEINVGKNNSYAMHSTNKAIDEIVKSYPTVADHLKMSLFISANNETVVIGHGNHDVINNNFLQKSHLIGSGGENIHIITSGHETLDIENLPIPEVIIYDDFNKKESLKDTLDLRQLVQQVNSDLSIEPISKITKDKNDLLIKLSISATGLQQDVVTVRLKDALVNSWYKGLQIILNNAPMKIDDNLDLSPLPLTFDEEIIVVTSEDVEEKDELIISKEAGQLTFLHSEYDLMITNAFNADVETNKLCTICLKDFYREPKMETLSIKFTDKEILLSDEMDKINNADSISDKLNINDYISSIVKLQESSEPSEAASSNHPIRHRRHTDHSRREDGVYHKVQEHNNNYQNNRYYIDQLEIATSSGARPSSWINSCIAWMKDSIGGFFTSNSYINGKNRVNEIGYSTNYEKQQTFNHKPQMTVLGMGDKYLAQADINGTVLLADVLLAKRGKRKIYTSSMDQGLSQSQTLSSTLNIGRVFKEAIKKAALKSGISERRLNIDFVEIEKMEKEINNKIARGRFDEISQILKSYAEKACPSREAGNPGRLSPKKFNKFMFEFNNLSLDQSIQQILYNSKNNVLEGKGNSVQKQRRNSNLENKKPESYLDNIATQGCLTQARGLM
ncbi:latrotoxin-related protein [Candidatus Mesenet endosymbiont of Phosphuga atrata]|uniref:latrotoxin-related protein n=1 Tax=Candidatus Mesenet endosymbiont of Phosphuga atrata TaxID=3066221 RepID=UPI0030CFFD0E